MPYPVTPTLSVEAVQVRDTVVGEVAVAARLVGTDGANVSPLKVELTEIVVLAVILLESRTVTVMRFAPD